MCKKLLSLLLALCVAVSLAVVPASADTPDAGEASTPTQSAGLSEMEGLGDGSAALQIELGNGKKYVIGFTLGKGETRTIMRQSYEGYYWRDISGKPNASWITMLRTVQSIVVPSAERKPESNLKSRCV